jgi:hypothetical protein
MLPPIFAVDWASTSEGQVGGHHTSHKGGFLGIQRLLSVICPAPKALQAQIASSELAGEGGSPDEGGEGGEVRIQSLQP